MTEHKTPFPSRCKHAGLLWGLEGLAWSAELLPKVSMTLARLEEVDEGGSWANRPVASLCEILLPWHSQTAAGVDKRIAVLKSLADHTPAVAWKLLFAMMPQELSSADLTNRPVWRDWVSAWQEGTSNADYWKQVNAAAELIVQLVGSDASRTGPPSSINCSQFPNHIATNSSTGCRTFRLMRSVRKNAGILLNNFARPFGVIGIVPMRGGRFPRRPWTN